MTRVFEHRAPRAGRSPTIPASRPHDRGERAADAAAGGGGAQPVTGGVTPSQQLAVSPGWRQALDDSIGAGRSLPNAAGPESSLAHVRVHADDRAAQLCLEIGAAAFTYGRDIYFGRDRFQPGTPEGMRLIAHELAHVTQQGFVPFVQREPSHVVSHGETLWAIAHHYGVTVADLAAANHIAVTASLQPGQVLHVPVQSYKVVRGDTLYRIAHRFGVTEAAIQAANHLHGAGVQVGEVLRIPRQHTVGTLPGPPPAHPAHAAPPVHATRPPAHPTAPPAHPVPHVSPGAGAGHQPRHDYAGGSLRMRTNLFTSPSFKHVESSHHHSVFLKPGTHVDLVSVDAHDRDKIEVKGKAFEATSPPMAIVSPVTGWIHRSATDMTLGVFRDLAVTDRTATFGRLAHSSLDPANVHDIILHQTESTSQASTLSSYRTRIRKHSDIGAQFLIGETGEISDITGLDRRVSQIGAHGVLDPAVKNATSIGIEHVGMFHRIKPTSPPPGPHASAAQKKTWAADMARVRGDLAALPLSPGLRARLLALGDRRLWRTLEDSRERPKHGDWLIYGDINAAQKRSSYLLTQRLRAEYGLGASDLHAHEAVRQKTLGEGENIKEFLTERETYPAHVRELRALANSRVDLLHSVAFMAVLQHEEAVAAALAADATATENAALNAERASKTAGPATGRELERTRFYEQFWVRTGQLTELLTFLKGAHGHDTHRLSALLSAWHS